MLGFRFKEEKEDVKEFYSHYDAWSERLSMFFIDNDGDLLMITDAGWLTSDLSHQEEDFASYPVYPVNIEEIEFYKE